MPARGLRTSRPVAARRQTVTNIALTANTASEKSPARKIAWARADSISSSNRTTACAPPGLRRKPLLAILGPIARGRRLLLGGRPVPLAPTIIHDLLSMDNDAATFVDEGTREDCSSV